MAARALILVVLAGCGSATGPGGQASGAWERLPDAPLSPREHAVAVGIDERVLVVGGSDASPCPPGADCNAPDELALANGAVYDSTSDQWRPIADAPLPIEWADTVVIGTTIYLLIPETFRPGNREAFLAYDIDADVWTELPLPPNAEAVYCCALAAAGTQIVAYPGSDEQGETADHIFDPATEQWTELPADPLSSTFDRVMVWSGTELILFAKELVDQPGSAEPSLSVVASLNLEPEVWRRMPDTGSLGAGGVLVDGLIVDPRLGWADGGQTNNWGQGYPYGGILNPATGEWSPLPNAPDGQDEYSAGLVATGLGYFVSDSGWVLDVDAGQWNWIEPRRGSERGPDGPFLGGVTITNVGESMFVFGGVRWEEFDSDFEWLDEVWLWSP